jgi:hypothetical protein
MPPAAGADPDPRDGEGDAALSGVYTYSDDGLAKICTNEDIAIAEFLLAWPR